VASVALRQATAGSDLARDMCRFWRSLKPIPGRALAPAWLTPRQRGVVDGQEAVRLHLVALACEILVLVRHIEQELPDAHSELEAQEIRISCCQPRSAAEQLLSGSANTEEHSLTDLFASINVAYTHLVDVRRLRERVTAMRPRKTAHRGHSR
jgi:hypothetical protein